MSIKVQSDLWKNSKQKGSALLLMLAIADFADDDGIAYPSIAKLAEKTRLKPRGVQYILGELQKSGELAIERSAGPKGCNLFRVQSLHGANIARVHPVVEGGAIASAPEPSRTIRESIPAKKQGARKPVDLEYSPDFEAFWQNSSKRGSKFEAYLVWRKIRPDPDLSAKMQAKMKAQMGTAEWLEEDGKYIPHVCRWLKKRRWDDEVRTAKTARPTRVVL